ncbi:MAG: heat shock protein transcriptional repressor HspR [Ilumatobacteraceae bacterium]|jgi:MerR family transcriptional regulator/heat shock protein HspR|nr:MerR family transcriptional regulator [Actinomycetota bacterium]NCV97413.1 MerR family transcriptional regulator [Acidimicrobiia bacterium]NCV46584.1 MerR family transcriptional regulator [Actinomycetota bacterium]NCX17384.1 MerR family transcriptional regulator [Acidimicrobiia bacterium]NCX31032.1 MerR family transcriptional regulator [Actinomycetota bacterium]
MSTQPNRDNYRMAVYVISVAAELAGMHPQTLRNYERVGLLRPARTQGGNRRYSDADIQLLQRIARLVDLGMNLEGIRHVLELEAQVEELQREVETLRSHIARERASRGELVPTRQVLSVFTRRSGFLGDR